MNDLWIKIWPNFWALSFICYSVIAPIISVSSLSNWAKYLCIDLFSALKCCCAYQQLKRQGTNTPFNQKSTNWTHTVASLESEYDVKRSQISFSVTLTGSLSWMITQINCYCSHLITVLSQLLLLLTFIRQDGPSAQCADPKLYRFK